MLLETNLIETKTKFRDETLEPFKLKNQSEI